MDLLPGRSGLWPSSISGNWIGTNTTGTTSLPNTEDGIAASLWYGDGEGHSANEDDDAIDDTKEAWIPGETLGSNHTTGYSKGINGVMVDIANLADPDELSADDFTFERVVSGAWTTWTGSVTIAVREGDGVDGSDRVTLIWANNTFANTWLRVTVLATDDTGMPEPDVFRFGNLKGDAGAGRLLLRQPEGGCRSRTSSASAT